MANAAIDTGHGATLVLSSTAYAFNWVSMDLGEEAIPDVDATFLATTAFRRYAPGDLKEPGEVTIPFQWDSGGVAIVIGTVQTLTVTFPLAVAADGFGSSPQTTAATLAGTGYIKRVKRPNMGTDELQMGELTWKWNGATGPTWTAAT